MIEVLSPFILISDRMLYHHGHELLINVGFSFNPELLVSLKMANYTNKIREYALCLSVSK